MQTEDPYWLNEAYQNPINSTDVGLVQRNIVISKSAIALLFFCFNRQEKFLDYAGGYGMFTRLMRDFGYDYYTTDPFTPNLLAKGFDTIPERIELVSALECFEHFADPLAEIEKILAYSRNVFFTTQLIPEPAPKPDQWWYYAPHHGQHVAFYTPKTLRFIANKYNLQVYSLLNYHLFTEKHLNSIWYKFLIAAGRLGLAELLRFFQKSRTIQDSQLSVNQPYPTTHEL
ncbi:class I SAM-dependent methyltransferase [Spirosoma flavum]|uniref:Class I SAM-dependent methyltransferase n=1 Tax=Spirosoma flavum TaxID=2048557 RepID=A0ABW6AS05_9BACT